MDKRKHYTQMSEAETVKVMNAVRSNEYTFSFHAIERMNEKRITENQVLTMLSYGKVIEVHNNFEDEICVLMRGKVAGKWCNAVVALRTKRVVSCWWNDLNDTHRTLDRSQYKWNADLQMVL
jgi:hypothetical protein